MLKGQQYNDTDRPTAKRIRQLIEDQQYRCAMTGIELSPDDANLDHIVPISAGGEHVMGNVQVVHRVINQMKSTLPKDDFINWCRKIALHAEQNNEP